MELLVNELDYVKNRQLKLVENSDIYNLILASLAYFNKMLGIFSKIKIQKFLNLNLRNALGISTDLNSSYLINIQNNLYLAS